MDPEDLPRNHGKPWSKDDEYLCGHLFVTGFTTKAIATKLGRKNDSIVGRLEKLRLIERNWLNPSQHCLLRENFDRFIKPLIPDDDLVLPLNATPSTSTSKGTTMDKNIAALLKEDTYTVAVVFDSADSSPDGAPSQRKNTRPYTFVCDIPGVQENDSVIVDTANGFKVGVVLKVDEDLRIDPNSEIKYRWVVQRVDLAAFREKQARLEELELLLAQSYQANLRRSFAQSVLANLPDDGARNKVSGLLK